MKLLVIGAGSIGKRHAANAACLVNDVAVFDSDETKAESVAKEVGALHFSRLEEALAWQANGIVISTPHKTHVEIARKAIASGSDILIEKPISHTLDGVSELLSDAKKRKRRIFVVCNMRYHPAVKTLRENLPAIGDVFFARAQYGNYLPNMRPADYKTLYCAHKNQGGGVVLDAIHEIDYLGWLFGDVTAVTCEATKRSDLDIDVEDYAALNMTHATGIRSEIHLDYLQQFKRRGCEIVGSKGTLVWRSEGKKPEHCTVRLYESESASWRTLLDERNMDMGVVYLEMLEAFINSITKTNADPFLSTGEEALSSLSIALSAHRSVDEGRKIILS